MHNSALSDVASDEIWLTKLITVGSGIAEYPRSKKVLSEVLKKYLCEVDQKIDKWLSEEPAPKIRTDVAECVGNLGPFKKVHFV